MKQNLIWHIFLFLYIIKRCINYIVYPLEIYDDLNKIENFISFNSTYTTLEMGYPPQNVSFYFSLDHNKMNMTDIGCNKKNLFNITKSNSLVILGYPDENEDSYSSKVFALDILSFYDNINLTNITTMEKFYMYYTADLNKEENFLCGSIGLSLMKYETIDDHSDDVEYYLKYLRNQNKFFSFFHYNNKDYIVNGILLNENLNFKNIFTDVNNITWINPIMIDNSLHWEIFMNEIFYNDIYMKKRIIFELNPLFELIVGTNEYKINILKDFFKYYIDNKICSIKLIKGYHIFECEENKFEKKDIQNFPILYMTNNNINHIFEMIGEELFILINNKYYFKIIFPETESISGKWIIGKIFLRKYPTVFSPLSRLVGFYINPNKGIINRRGGEKKETQFKDKKDIFVKNIYLYLIIGFIFTSLGLYIGKKLFMIRKRKLNELVDDYYQYDSENEKDIKKEGNEDNNISIEMNYKLEK